jgi:hypothetical protein
MTRIFLGAPLARCLTALLILAPLVAACSNAGDNIRVPRMDEYNSDRGRSRVPGSLISGNSQQGILIFGTDRSGSGNRGAGADGGAGIGVNAYLWRATLDTLSFMPLASADPFGGVVITDWYTPPGVQNERFRATALILGRQLRSDGVRVVVHRQEQTRGGAWVDAPVSASTATELEDQVLQRARELRSQSMAAR